MARFAYGRHTAKVAIGTYPDDDSYPIGTNEWNEDINNLGMLGFTSVEGTCATNVVTLTGNAVANTGLSSVIRVDGQGDAADDLDGIAITDTNEYDLLYLFAENSGRAITVQHASGNVSTGKIYLLAGTGTKVLSTTTPMLVIRKGNDWYEYGGGAQTTPTDITVADTTDTTCFPSLFESATGDLAPKTDAGLTYNAGNATLTATTFAGALTGNASTATALATARTIGGTSFDGTANIAVALSATSTALATARTIGGVSFDGTANINLAGVNTAGNQNTSGTAAIATTVTITDNENSNESNAIVFTSGGTATGNLGLESDGDLTYNPSSGLVTVPALTVTGNLTVSGTTTTLDVTNLAVEDPLIQLAKANAGADTIDIGFWGLYDTSGSQDLRSGLFRDANDSGKWKLFKDTQEDLTSAQTINTGATGYATATLVANIEGNVTGNLTGDASGVADNVVGIAELAGIPRGKIIVGDASGDPSLLAAGADNTVLTMDSNGDVGWEAPAGGGATATHDFTLQAYGYTGGASSGTTRSIYTKVHKNPDGTEDTNNEDVFIKCKKNGTADTEVQIA